MMQSLLYQILKGVPATWKDFRKVYEKEKSKLLPQTLDSDIIMPSWDFGCLKSAFIGIINESTTKLLLYVIIDGMDESEENRRREMLELLSILCDSKNAKKHITVKLFIASRPVGMIGTAFAKNLTVTLDQETSKDISQYVTSKTAKISETIGKRMADLKGVSDEIIGRANGVFLWVVLVIPVSAFLYFLDHNPDN